jgi:hypothetical protein
MTQPTIPAVAVDLAKRIQRLEVEHGFSGGVVPEVMPSHGTRHILAIGAYRALTGIQWRMNHPKFLGTDL